MSNMVRTAKYEYYDFLPKFLWEEFNPATKIANVYFLFIAALQARYVLTLYPSVPMVWGQTLNKAFVQPIARTVADHATSAMSLRPRLPNEIRNRHERNIRMQGMPGASRVERGGTFD